MYGFGGLVETKYESSFTDFDDLEKIGSLWIGNVH